MSKIRVLVHCDDRRRDAMTIGALGLLLQARGYHVLISNRTNLRAYARLFAPHILVLSHSCIVFSSEELRQIAKKARIVVVPTEGAMFTRTNVVRAFAGAPPQANAETRRAYTAHVTRVLMWGDAMRRAVLEDGIYHDAQVAVVGNPRFDVYRTGAFAAIRSQHNHSDTVGVVSSSPVANPFDQRNPIAYLDVIRQDEDKKFPAGKRIEDFLWYVYGGLRAQFELIHGLAQRNTVRVSLRPHPYEYARNYDFFPEKAPHVSVADNTEPFYKWLARMRVIVTVSSTTVVEGFVTGTPVITLESVLGPSLDDHLPGFTDHRLPLLRYCHRPATTEEAVDMAHRACKGELSSASVAGELAHWLRDYYDWPANEPTLLRIVAHVDDIAGRHANRDIAEPASAAFGWQLPLYGHSGRSLLRYALHGLVGSVTGSRRAEARSYTYRFSHFFPWHRRDQREAKKLVGFLSHAT